MLARLTALVLAIAMLAPSGAFGAVLYLCEMDGQAHTSCCCKSPGDEAEEPCATIERECCCDVQVTKGEQVPAKLDHLAPRLELPAFAAVLPTPWRGPQPTQPGLLLPLGARAPPLGVGPPIFIRNCSYLI